MSRLVVDPILFCEQIIYVSTELKKALSLLFRSK